MDFNELRNETEKKHTHLRINLIGGFLAVCLLIFAGLLFYTQKINGAEYLSQSVRTITRSEKVEAPGASSPTAPQGAGVQPADLHPDL